MNLLFNFFEGSNERIICKEAEGRSSMVECEETPLELGGACEMPMRLPMQGLTFDGPTW